MVVPLSCTPGSVLELTVPIADSYYVWQGKPTSAQYYVNPAGTSLEDGCVWGDPNGDLGNWSPMIFGAGYSNGISWLSISQNQLNSRPLGYNVKVRCTIFLLIFEQCILTMYRLLLVQIPNLTATANTKTVSSLAVVTENKVALLP